MQTGREIAHEIALEVGIVRHLAAEQLVEQGDLGIGQQHGKLRPGERGRLRLALRHVRLVGQELDLAIKLASMLQLPHQPGLEAHFRHAARFDQRQGKRLNIVVAQAQLGHLIGHLRQKLVARGPGELAGRLRRTQRDLDVDLHVGRVHARGIVDRIGVGAPAVERELDARALRQTEIGALADDLDTELLCGDAHRVVGPVAGIVVGLGARPYVGPDATEPQEVGFGFEQSLDQFEAAPPACRSDRSAARISSVSSIALSARENTPPPLLISLAL